MAKDNGWSGTGYDAEPSTGGGLYLRLKEKGESIRIRLVSDPFRYEDVFKAEGEDDKIIRKVAWIVIHKTLVDGKKHLEVKVFQSGPMVYGLIKDLTENPEWGDPKLYDIEVTRTEVKGRYYSVQPLPKPMGPLSEAEAEMVVNANIDLASACLGKKTTTERKETESAEGTYNPFDEE